jgi:hypothetical protein
MNDIVNWTRIVEPRERYRILYQGSDGLRTEREITLSKVGESRGRIYFAVTDRGKPKTFRADHVLEVLEQLTTGHAPSIHAAPNYATKLPAFPIAGAVYKIGTIAVSNRSWTVDLNKYTCSCPEKRIRSGLGYEPGQVGYVCAHMAKAILEHLPAGTPGWTDELRAFLADPRRIHIDNLS